MPIYEYACAACGHEFEEWQKMSDAPVKTCPKCKKKKVERLISRTAFQLKGGGWYADLYSSTKPGESKAESGEKSEGAKEASSPAKDSSADASGSKDAPKTTAKASESPSKKKSAKKAESRAA